MIGDNVAIATCMYLTTDLGAPLFGVFLFVTFATASGTGASTCSHRRRWRSPASAPSSC